MSSRTRAATHTARIAASCMLLVSLWGMAAETRAADGPSLAPRYRRVEQRFQVPDAILTDSTGKSFSLAQELGADGPVILTFFSTAGCPAECRPTQVFAEVPGTAGLRPRNLRLISIALNPREDTPARLRAYARQLGAGPDWMLLTGSRRELAPVLQAFGAGGETRDSATFIHPGPRAAWVRLDGPVSAADLTNELH